MTGWGTINTEFCLVGHLKIGSVGWPEFFIFSILPTSPDRIYPSTPPIKFIATPPHPEIEIIYDPLPSQFNYYIVF